MADQNERRRMRLTDLKCFALLPLLDAAAQALGRVDPPVVNEVQIECLPTGELVCGHWRVRRLIAEGVKTAVCVVQHDLAKDPMDVVGLHALRAYTAEIGCDEPTRASLFHTWDLWRRKLPREDQPVARPSGELDQEILAILGVSRRSLLRHRATLALKRDEMALLTQLRVPKWACERIARLSLPAREGIIAELCETANVSATLADRFPDARPTRHKTTANAMAAFVRALRHGLTDMAGRVGEVDRLSHEQQATLREAVAVIEQILARAVVWGGVREVIADARTALTGGRP